jgi:hypothetical protein
MNRPVLNAALGFFGAARFAATPATFERIDSLKVSVAAPAEPWLSVNVDPSRVDWRLYDEVVVELRRDGTPEASGTLRFTAADGPRPWGFYGASAAQRRYDVEATYRSPDGERTLTRQQQTAALFVLPAAPEGGR